MPADLHLHTVHSDGSWSPTEVVEQALKHELSCIAVTDHDTVAGIAEARLAGERRLEVIAGIEINTLYDTNAGRKLDVHVLGYFIDPNHASLKRIIQRQQEARNQLVEDTIAACRRAGINLQMEHVEQCIGIGSIGRPHLARAIVKAGGAKNVTEAFERFMMRSSTDYVPRSSVSTQDALLALEDCGAITSIAHPARTEGIGEVILSLKDCGLQAIEAYHRSHSLDLLKHYLRFAHHNSMLITGGSDCHGPSDGFPASIGSVKVPLEVVHALKSALPVAS